MADSNGADPLTGTETRRNEPLLREPKAPWRTPSPPLVDNKDDVSDTDSTLAGANGLSLTAHPRSRILEDIEENGRTYHRFRQGKYMLPNDLVRKLDASNITKAIELTKFNKILARAKQTRPTTHIVHDDLEGKLHLAPISSTPQNVLDVATGTGLWAIKFAQEYPSARVLGTDLSAIQPLNVPINCRFLIDDAEDEWNFEKEFDYIHGRALLSCFKNPEAVLQQAYKSLAPGAYLELQDMIFPFEFLGKPPTESPLYKWYDIIAAAAANLGRPWTNVKNYKRWMEDIGFEDVVEKKFYWPLNAWPQGKYYKQLSTYAQANFLSGLEGLSLRVMGSAGWSVDNIKAYLEEVRKEVEDTSVHSYVSMLVVYGKKREDNHKTVRSDLA